MNVSIDFDGVLNEYTGFDENDLGEPKLFVEEFLKKLSSKYDVIIFTCRKSPFVWKWLRKNKLDQYITEVTNRKKPSQVYVDDRAIQFKGNFNETLNEINEYVPYWKTKTTSENHEAESVLPREIINEPISKKTYHTSTPIHEQIEDIEHTIKRLKERRIELIVKSFEDGSLKFIPEGECFDEPEILCKFYYENKEDK